MDILEIISQENILALNKYLNDNELKVGEHRKIQKQIAKSNWNIEDFRTYSPTLKWYWFNINLLRSSDFDQTMEFIDNNLDYFNSWYSVDGSLMFMRRKGITFNKIYKYSQKYTKDMKREFVCRFGYILFFLSDFSSNNIEKFSELFHDDPRYYVQMMEAWLICEMVTKNPSKGYELLKDSKLKYNILGKAIQKCLDSFRIDELLKEKIKMLREEKKLYR